MNGLDRTEFFDAISALERKLLEQLHTGLSSVNTALLRLQESSHVALLEQERRNSTFATRELVDRLAATMDTLARQQAQTDTRTGEALRLVESVTGDLETLRHTVSDRNLAYIRAAAGFLASLLAVILAVTLTYVLAHAG